MCLLYWQFYSFIINIVHFNEEKSSIVCFDLNANVLGKNSEHHFLKVGGKEGGGGGIGKSIVLQRGGHHQIVVRWGQNF